MQLQTRGGLAVPGLVPFVPLPCLVPASPFSLCCSLVLCSSQLSCDFVPPSPFLMYWSTTENKVVTSDSLKLLFCCSMYVAKRALREQFDPRIYHKETYLLCHLRWGNSKACWIHWVRNDNDNDNNCHAEVYFLEKIFELRSSNFCDITWYLSWSPCATCCYIIRNFLERHRNVNIDIRVARLYETYRPETRRGLRELASLQHRVTVRVMDIEGKVPRALWDWGGVSW